MPTSDDASNPVRPGRLIVLDDEIDIRRMLQRFLIGQGFDVRIAKDGAQLDAFLERYPFDLLVLDIMMPGEDGLSICRRLRAQGHAIPILMLTARGDPIDKVVGLEMGADDYLAKPFAPSELVARIRALLRRQQRLQRQQSATGDLQIECDFETLRFGAFRLDLRRQELFEGDRPVNLNSAEMRLLCALAASPNRPVSRANLLERARGRAHEANERSVDVQVLRLRQMIELDVAAPRHIRTVWGLGYMLIADIAT
jgi:two-component system phosphate regulon response regulator OmpR